MIALGLLIEIAAGFSAGSILTPLDQMLRVDMAIDAAARIGTLKERETGSFVDQTLGEAAVALAEHTPTKAQKTMYEKLRYSTVRLQAIVSDPDLMRPWMHAGQEQTFVGSGFVVRNSKTKGPLVITNAHVVTNAMRLTLQVPAGGQQSYRARVVLVNPDMDIALVELSDEGEVEQLVKDVGFMLPKIKLFKGKATLGKEVMTMGYPLGQDTLKVSKGVLSGHEKVGDFMAFQQTAPISPGNSGGPLFIDGTSEVVGINFAAAVGDSSQNNNYAIPAWHVMQMLHEYDSTEEEGSVSASYSQFECRQSHTNCLYRVPRLKAMASEGNDALYERYGCTTGIFISKIEKESMALSAEPPLERNSFIVSVDGKPVDKFGMTKSEDYFDDPILFTDMLFLSATMAPVDVEVCTCGETATHKVKVSALTAPKKAEEPIANYDEPGLHTADFEQFAGLTIQPLSMNIIKALAQGPMKRMDMLRFAVSTQKKPLLVVTEISRINEKSGSVQVGDIVRTVNGHPTTTMAELRAHFEPSGDETEEAESAGETCKAGSMMWTLETATGKELALEWREAIKEQAAAITKGEKPLTKAVRKAMKKLQHKLPSMVEETMAAAAPVAGEPRPVEERREVRRGGAWELDIPGIFHGTSA